MIPTKDVLFYLKLLTAKIDQKAVLNSGGPKISQELRDVFINKTAARFHFHNQLVGHKQVRAKVTQQSSIFIRNV
jgi:hypothetical protein